MPCTCNRSRKMLSMTSKALAETAAIAAIDARPVVTRTANNPGPCIAAPQRCILTPNQRLPLGQCRSEPSCTIHGAGACTMANLNKVMLIGRLTRDPEVRTFATGGKVAKLGFAVNNRKKDAQTGQFVDDPVFLDLEVFNRGEQGRQADLAAESLRKGHQAFIEGHLRLDQWLDKDGQKRSKLVVVVDNF